MVPCLRNFHPRTTFFFLVFHLCTDFSLYLLRTKDIHLSFSFSLSLFRLPSLSLVPGYTRRLPHRNQSSLRFHALGSFLSPVPLSNLSLSLASLPSSSSLPPLTSEILNRGSLSLWSTSRRPATTQWLVVLRPVDRPDLRVFPRLLALIDNRIAD